ncbi:hypothetical protein M885DRAFT_545342 [Pelagophyceae sp. CCMP2097]|nr:hypothetical protein M885DRAFT_545342 [Pelagophyceae sp. CCMP2097]|mmetsp:Transcript_16248/g.56774  ORF Transcript_16248/g.56774 Transcript_16248/m.56774 type:complete len:175 (+) Transcript_16248:41-565(+)
MQPAPAQAGLDPVLFATAQHGRLTRHEVKCCITAAFGFRPDKREVAMLLGADGTAAAGDVSRFLETRLPKKHRDDDVRQIWDAFDEQRRGYLTADAVVAVFAAACPAMPARTVIAAFEELDVGRTGKIGYQHFVSIMREPAAAGAPRATHDAAAPGKRQAPRHPKTEADVRRRP